MKTHKIISIAVALGLLVSCGDRLEVTNPNKFTVDDINKNILQSGDESKIKLALEGMANTMPTEMMVYNTKLTKGYGNRWSADATHQLAHDMLIGDIAEQCGFQDVAYFSRVFRQYYGKTPTQARNSSL